MDRKDFISMVTGSAGLIPVLSRQPGIRTATQIIPPYLKPGDTIGITSPAGYINLDDICPAIDVIKSWGYEIKTGTTIGKRFFGFGGTDDERTADLQSMLDDPSVKAIMCARGGYGIVRIIDRLDFTKFSRHPKWVIGFSDITALHSHLNRQYNIPSIHSKMCNSFPKDWNAATDIQKATIDSIRRSIAGEHSLFSVPPSRYNKPGMAEAQLVGGNLKTLESLSGTYSDLYTNGKILFVEDTGEYLYSIDRMFWNLKRTGKLIGLKGLIIGGFKVKPDDPGEEFGISLQDIILDKVKDNNYPVCFDFPVGHQPDNFALKCGIKHRLTVDNNTCTLEEII
jgi:muramoyltetrapeptide carboxypeptidase